MKQYVFDSTRYKANRENIIKDLGLFIDGSIQGFSFSPPETCKPIKQTTWNTKHLHRIAWSSGKLDEDKLFAVFYDIKKKNAEVFAKGLENCRLLTRVGGQNVEKLDDYGCPKIQDLIGEGKTDSSWTCSSSLSDPKQGFTVPRVGCMRMRCATIKFVNFVTCSLYFCLLLI